MFDDHVELKIPVEPGDREDLERLYAHMGDTMTGFDEAISNGGLSRECMEGPYHNFMSEFGTWAKIALKYSILQGESSSIYVINEGLCGSYRDMAQRALRDFHQASRLFEMVSSSQSGEPDDDLPF